MKIPTPMASHQQSQHNTPQLGAAATERVPSPAPESPSIRERAQSQRSQKRGEGDEQEIERRTPKRARFADGTQSTQESQPSMIPSHLSTTPLNTPPSHHLAFHCFLNESRRPSRSKSSNVQSRLPPTSQFPSTLSRLPPTSQISTTPSYHPPTSHVSSTPSYPPLSCHSVDNPSHLLDITDSFLDVSHVLPSNYSRRSRRSITSRRSTLAAPTTCYLCALSSLPNSIRELTDMKIIGAITALVEQAAHGPVPTPEEMGTLVHDFQQKNRAEENASPRKTPERTTPVRYANTYTFNYDDDNSSTVSSNDKAVATQNHQESEGAAEDKIATPASQVNREDNLDMPGSFERHTQQTPTRRALTMDTPSTSHTNRQSAHTPTSAIRNANESTPSTSHTNQETNRTPVRRILSMNTPSTSNTLGNTTRASNTPASARGNDTTPTHHSHVSNTPASERSNDTTPTRDGPESSIAAPPRTPEAQQTQPRTWASALGASTLGNMFRTPFTIFGRRAQNAPDASPAAAAAQNDSAGNGSVNAEEANGNESPGARSRESLSPTPAPEAETVTSPTPQLRPNTRIQSRLASRPLTARIPSTPKTAPAPRRFQTPLTGTLNANGSPFGRRTASRPAYVPGTIHTERRPKAKRIQPAQTSASSQYAWSPGPNGQGANPLEPNADLRAIKIAQLRAQHSQAQVQHDEYVRKTKEARAKTGAEAEDEAQPGDKRKRGPEKNYSHPDHATRGTYGLADDFFDSDSDSDNGSDTESSEGDDLPPSKKQKVVTIEDIKDTEEFRNWRRNPPPSQKALEDPVLYARLYFPDGRQRLPTGPGAATSYDLFHETARQEEEYKDALRRRLAGEPPNIFKSAQQLSQAMTGEFARSESPATDPVLQPSTGLNAKQESANIAKLRAQISKYTPAQSSRLKQVHTMSPIHSVDASMIDTTIIENDENAAVWAEEAVDTARQNVMGWNPEVFAAVMAMNDDEFPEMPGFPLCRLVTA
jgi:hypothetical protein